MVMGSMWVYSVSYILSFVQISTQNKELKRQSKMLLDLQGPNPPDITKMNLDLDLDEKEDSMEEYRQEQSQKIQSTTALFCGINVFQISSCQYSKT